MDLETAQMAENTKTESVMIVGGDDDDVFNLESGRKLKPRPPPFLTKTFELVDHPETNSYITWNSSGTGFIIFNHNKFSSHVLPNIFKTSNFSSFVYQLNSYGFRKISWERYEYANQWFQAGKKHWLENIKRRNQKTDWSQLRKKRASSTTDPISTNDIVEKKLDALITEQNDMKQIIQSLKQSLKSMEGQLTSLEVPKFSELEDEKTSIAVFLKRLMEEFLKNKKVEAGDENSNRPRLTDISAAEPADKADKELSLADHGSKSLVQDQVVEEKAVEITENSQIWIDMLVENEAGFKSNGRLADLHSKAMFELDEMMESDIVMQQKVMVAKPSDLHAEDEDNGHLELWM